MKKISLLFFLFFCFSAFANDSDLIINPTPLRVFQPMRPTPERLFKADISMPDQFTSSNNLAKKPGSFYRAFGEIIFIQGTVTDSFALPISGAIIEIWQANSAGKYHTLLDHENEYVDKYFSMSGRTITDNLGNYSFITVMPGGTAGRAPHINMNVYHSKFGKLETEIYFEKHPYNETDNQYLAYDEKDRAQLTAQVRHTEVTNTKSIKICTFDIVLKGIHQYKRN